MERDGFKFDLETQRFIKNRWDTEVGQRVRQEIIDGIKNSVEIRAILDDYVLEHPENIDPYGHPIYPKTEMRENSFWVLTQDDLRGIHIYNEDLSSSPCLEKKALSYSSFYNCNLSSTNMEMADYSYSRFEKCNMEEVVFAASGGFSVRIIDCNLKGACFWQSGFRGCDLSGSDLSGAYFEGALLEDLRVDYKTKFDLELAGSWKNREMPGDQRPDILRSIRLAYEKAELWAHMDAFLYKEKVAQRKFILWKSFQENKSIQGFYGWLSSLLLGALSGYTTKPIRVIVMAGALSLIFAALYLMLGTPSHTEISAAAIMESLYFSFTTFATLGYGDISYSACHPYLRILSTAEAWMGAITLSLFVVVLARKVFR
ncbi:pentapeptide repeat-containing protein [Gilvimarinus chinensis]|uniref:pentapeptide repeat-containing protein n=1 Tax=Gilvimarinus chinensis TaxID=396005 RepID=UPI00037655EE|nr:pentapeptide repeat-containing protein [Gilvimarinus chinensis]